jgi:integrase
MAHVERHHRKPCGRPGCAHGFAKHGRTARGACTTKGCACTRWISAPGDRETLRARWRDPSGRERSKSFARKVDADRFLVAIEGAKPRGAYVDPAAGRLPFGEWAERWFRSKAHLKPSTRHDYRALLDHQILPTFRDVSLASIDTLAVWEWVAGLVAGGLSPKRAGKALQVLAQVLASAVEGGRLAVNRAAGVKPPKGQRSEMHFLDSEQVEAAVEVSRLEWGPVKTHEARTVRMPRSVADELGAYLADRPHEPDALVFTAPMGGPLDRATFVRQHFKPAILAANEALALLPRDQRPRVTPRGPSLLRPAPHLRHTCASLLIAQGASIKAVQKQLGHKTASITLDTYGHLFPSKLEALRERLEQVREAAKKRRSRYPGGPVVVPLRKAAGQESGG